MIQIQQHPQQPSKINGACFNCKKEGHWARDCPLISPNKKNRSPNKNNRIPNVHSSSTPDYPAHHCRCGAGICEIRVSYSPNNPGRLYYRCPAKFEMDCKYFKWCDQLKSDEILKVGPKPYPICGGCGAGVCSVKVEENEPNVGRTYFACPIKQGYGMCSFRQWVDIYFGESFMEEDQEMLSYEAEMQIKAVEMMFSPEPSLKKAKVQMVNTLDESIDVELGTSTRDPEVHLCSIRMKDELENVKSSTIVEPLGNPSSGDLINLLDDKFPMMDPLNVDDLRR